MIRTFIRFTLLLAALALLGAALAQDDEFVIGWSGAVTGPTSDAGQFVIQGVEDYCRYAQEENLLGDITLTCLTRDDQYDNDITLRNFEAFLDQGMDAFISYATGGTLQLKINAVEEQIPVISASLHIGVILPPDNDYNFLPTTSYSEQVVALLDWIAANHEGDGAPRVALMVHPSAFGRAPVEDGQEAAEVLGIEIVEVQEHGGTIDYTAMLQRWSNNGVEYVVTQTVQSPVAALLNAADALGLKESMTFMGAHYTGGATLVSLAGEAAEGFLWATSFPLSHEIPLQIELGARYNRPDATVEDVNYTTGLLQAATFVEAARRALDAGQGMNSAAIYEQLLQMNADEAGVFETPFGVGPVSYDEDDRVGVGALRLLEVVGGEFQPFTEPFNSETFAEIQAN